MKYSLSGKCFEQDFGKKFMSRRIGVDAVRQIFGLVFHRTQFGNGFVNGRDLQTAFGGDFAGGIRHILLVIEPGHPLNGRDQHHSGFAAGLIGNHADRIQQPFRLSD